MGLVIDDTLISNQAQNLQAAMTTDPKMRKVIQQHIREALFAARREVMNSVNFANGDPHESVKSIRTSVYEKVLGGNINILTGKSAKSGGNGYEPRRTLRPKQRGGNRRERGDRTKAIQGYSPYKRGFILRFVNSGTKTRYANGRNGRTEAQYIKHVLNTGGTYHRGAIAARNWFMDAAERALGYAAQNIANMIETEAEALLNKES